MAVMYSSQDTAHAFRMYVTTQANGSSGYAAGMSVCEGEKGRILSEKEEKTGIITGEGWTNRKDMPLRRNSTNRRLRRQNQEIMDKTTPQKT